MRWRGEEALDDSEGGHNHWRCRGATVTLSQAVVVPEVRHSWLSLRLGLCAAAEGPGPWPPGLVRSREPVRVRP